MPSFSLNVQSIETEERFGKNLLSTFFDHPGTNIFVETQLPGFVREDHPRFVAFLEAYYKWLDQNNNIGQKILKIKQQQDIDTASSEFVEKFYKEFLVNIPRTALTNKKVLLKYIREFYRAKGTEKSYKLFFRMLYDTNVDFYYPSKDIFKLSDGKWVQRKIMRIFPSKGATGDFYNKKIIGKQSGSAAFVTEIYEVIVDGYYGYEMVLNTSSITGTFFPNEIVTTEDNFFGRITSIPTKYEFAYDSMLNKKTGTGYKPGDTFKLLNAKGRGARIKVASIIPTKRVETEVVITSVGNADGVSSINIGNKNLTAIVSVICANDGGRYQKEPKSIPQVDPDGTVHESVRSFYTLESDQNGNSILVLKDSYEPPKGRVRVQYEHLVEDVTGEIDKLTIVNFGMEYISYENDLLRTFRAQLNSQTCVSKNFTGDGEAEIILTSNAIGTYPGFYANEDGHLSTSKYIQDGEYYQQYSYVTITDQPVSDYRDSLKTMVHPIGFKLFGKFRPQHHLDMKSKFGSQTGRSSVRREFKQFPRPTAQGKNGTLVATPKVKTFVSVIKQTSNDRSAFKLGPSNYSIFRERFNYKPTEKYNANSEMSGANHSYWENQFANTSIDKFKDMIPIVLEGVTIDVKNQLISVQDKQKEHMRAVLGRQLQRCDMIYNSTFNIVEMYDDTKWIEIAPNKRINMLPDFVVATTGIILSENGDLELKLTSVRSIENLGKPKISLI